MPELLFSKENSMLRIHTKPDKNSKKLTVCCGELEAVEDGDLTWMFDSSFSCWLNQGEFAPLKFPPRCGSKGISGSSGSATSASGSESSYDIMEASHAIIVVAILIGASLCAEIQSYALAYE